MNLFRFPIVEAQLAQGGESIIDDIAYEDDLSYDEAETSHQSADEDEHEEEEEEGEGEQDMDGNPSHSSVRMIPSNIVVRKKKRTVHFQDAFLSNDDDDDDDDDDGTLVVERKLKRLSTTSMSSASSLGGQYITTPHRQSENVQYGGDDEDAYAVAVNSSAEVFSTTRLLPKYTETSISEEA